MILLASYQNEKMLDFRCVSVRKGTAFSLSVLCPEGAEIKLFRTDSAMRPLGELQDKQFLKAPEQDYFPLTIIGPNGSMSEENGLRIENSRLAIQASNQSEDAALYVPEKDCWQYEGWLFTAEKDGVTEELGIYKHVTPELFDALLPKMLEGWNITMDSDAPGREVHTYETESDLFCDDCDEIRDGGYPLTIIGPNGSMHEEYGIRVQDGQIAIQASDQNADGALYVPEKPGWIYYGWLFFFYRHTLKFSYAFFQNSAIHIIAYAIHMSMLFCT